MQKKIDYIGILLTIMGASCWGLSGSVGQYLFDVQQMDSQWLVPIRLGFVVLHSSIRQIDNNVVE